MLNSPLLKANPNLYVFLPILYTVWADAILTPSEIKTLKGLIESQAWLNDKEKSFLLEQLNPASPPTPDEFKNWLTEIRRAADLSTSASKVMLVDIGVSLAELHGDGSFNDSLAQARQSMAQIDETLGLISGESIYYFAPERRTTITQQQITHQTFDVDTMNKILDGPEAGIIKKVKTLLSDPEFKYIDTDNLSEYREKVLQWCRRLEFFF